MVKNLYKSDDRVRDFDEVFTQPREINSMLGMLPASTFEPSTTFLEPSCGTGGFLVAILHRKLTMYDHTPITAFIALSSLYGVEIQQDNVHECINNLVKEAARHNVPNKVARFLFKKNIIHGDFISEAGVNFTKWACTDKGSIKWEKYTLNGIIRYVDNRAQLFDEFPIQSGS